MRDKAIYHWLHQARASGLSDMKIVEKLKDQGWSNDQIDQILVGAYTEKVQIINKTETNHKKNEKIFSPAEKYQKEHEHKGKISNDLIDKLPDNYPIGNQIISRTKNIFKKNWGQLLSLSLIQSGLILLFIYYSNNLSSITFSSGFIISIINIFLYITLLLILKDGKNIITSFFKGFTIFFQYLFTTILASLIILGGTLLLILPGILMSLAFVSLPYIMIEEKKYGLQAIKRAYTLAYKNRGSIFWNSIKYLIISVSILIIATILIVAIVFVFDTQYSFEIQGQSPVWMGMFFISIFSLSFISMLSAVFFKNIYIDLNRNNDFDTPYEIEKQGGERAIIYLVLGILLIGFNIYSMMTYDENKPPSIYNFSNPNSIIGEITAKDLPFKYNAPSNFKNDFNTEYKNGYSSTYVYQIPNTTDKININIYLEENKDDLTAEEYLDINESIFENIYDSNTVIFEGTKKIDGTDGYLIEKNYEFYDTKKYSNKIAYVKNDFIVEITLECGARYYLDYKNVFNDSLKTFKLK